jgi:hypothetical protein
MNLVGVIDAYEVADHSGQRANATGQVKLDNIITSTRRMMRTTGPDAQIVAI